MMEKALESREALLEVRRPGGNASKSARRFRVFLPTKWLKVMGVTPEDRAVKLSFDGSKITITKKEETQEEPSEDSADLREP